MSTSKRENHSHLFTKWLVILSVSLVSLECWSIVNSWNCVIFYENVLRPEGITWKLCIKTVFRLSWYLYEWTVMFCFLLWFVGYNLFWKNITTQVTLICKTMEVIWVWQQNITLIWISPLFCRLMDTLSTKKKQT